MSVRSNLGETRWSAQRILPVSAEPRSPQQGRFHVDVFVNPSDLAAAPWPAKGLRVHTRQSSHVCSDQGLPAERAAVLERKEGRLYLKLGELVCERCIRALGSDDSAVYLRFFTRDDPPQAAFLSLQTAGWTPHHVLGAKVLAYRNNWFCIAEALRDQDTSLTLDPRVCVSIRDDEALETRLLDGLRGLGLDLRADDACSLEDSILITNDLEHCRDRDGWSRCLKIVVANDAERDTLTNGTADTRDLGNTIWLPHDAAGSGETSVQDLRLLVRELLLLEDGAARSPEEGIPDEVQVCVANAVHRIARSRAVGLTAAADRREISFGIATAVHVRVPWLPHLWRWLEAMKRAEARGCIVCTTPRFWAAIVQHYRGYKLECLSNPTPEHLTRACTTPGKPPLTLRAPLSLEDLESLLAALPGSCERPILLPLSVTSVADSPSRGMLNPRIDYLAKQHRFKLLWDSGDEHGAGEPRHELEVRG